MNVGSCPKSEHVIRAIRSGNWPEGLPAHVEACEPCRETSRVASWMTQMAAGLESVPGELPDPELIRLKARISRRSRLPERALLPLKAGSLFGVAGAGLLFASIPGSVWNRVQEWLPGESVLIRWQELLLAIPAISWWIPVAAILFVLLVFTNSEA